jgi:hypothetical protein
MDAKREKPDEEIIMFDVIVISKVSIGSASHGIAGWRQNYKYRLQGVVEQFEMVEWTYVGNGRIDACRLAVHPGAHAYHLGVFHISCGTSCQLVGNLADCPTSYRLI